MNRPRAKTIFYSVVIGGCTFFILETGWIPLSVKIIISFAGGICVGGAIEQDHANYWESKRTIDRVQTDLNQQLSGQKTVTVMRLLTLLEEMKDNR